MTAPVKDRGWFTEWLDGLDRGDFLLVCVPAFGLGFVTTFLLYTAFT